MNTKDLQELSELFEIEGIKKSLLTLAEEIVTLRKEIKQLKRLVESLDTRTTGSIFIG